MSERKIKTQVPVMLTVYGEQSDEIMVDVEIRHYPGCPDTYDPAIGGPGGWSPGDAPETELLSAKINGEPVPAWFEARLYYLDWAEALDGTDVLEPDEPEYEREP